MQARVYLIILRAVVLLQPAAACAMGDRGLALEDRDALARCRAGRVEFAPGMDPAVEVAGPR